MTRPPDATDTRRSTDDHAPHRHRRRAARRTRASCCKAEKELTRLNDDLAQRRRELPWVRVDKDYRFDTEDGEATLADLFHGRSQLDRVPLHVRARLGRGLPELLGVADGFDETHLHLQNHDVAFTAVSRAPLDEAARLPRPHGLELPVGVVGARATSTSTSTCRSPRSRSRRARRTTSAPLEGWQVDPTNLPFEGPGMSALINSNPFIDVYLTYPLI